MVISQAMLAQVESSTSTRWRAIAVLAAAILITAGCLLGVRRSSPDPSSAPALGDAALYERVVERIRGGQPYYEALGAELRAGDYPMRSIFNWRTPLHLEFVAHVPAPFSADRLLASAALFMAALAALGFIRQGRPGLALAQLPLLCIPMAMAFVRPGQYFGETWAGLLIALSVCMYRLGWKYAAVAAALAALFFRELALPYVLICVILALAERRFTEVRLYAAGLVAWVCYFGIHAFAVISRMPPSDGALSVDNWIRFGGVAFLLNASRMGMLLAFPVWVTALYLPFAMLGIAAGKDAASWRAGAALAAYLLAFSVAGMPENFYWGGIHSPLLALCAVWTLPAGRDVVAALIGRKFWGIS